MTNATKTLALFFAATLVLALAATWGGSSTSSAAFQGTLFAVDSAQVQAIRLDRAEGSSVRLEKTDGSWSVAPADTSASYPANVQAVRRVLRTLPSLEVSTVATRQPEKHARYGVDSTGTTVTMLGTDDEALGRLIVGRTEMQQPSRQQQPQNPMRRRAPRGTPITYVRVSDQPDVYSVEQPLSSLLGRSVEDWREKQIWALDQSQIQRIEFDYPADSSFTARRVVQSDTTGGAPSSAGKWVSDGDTLASNQTSSLLRTLATPQADGFPEGTTPNALGDAQYTIRLELSDGSSRALHFYPDDTGANYLVTADGYPYVARILANRWDQSALRGRSAFLQDN